MNLWNRELGKCRFCVPRFAEWLSNVRFVRFSIRKILRQFENLKEENNKPLENLCFIGMYGGRKLHRMILT